MKNRLDIERKFVKYLLHDNNLMFSEKYIRIMKYVILGASIREIVLMMDGATDGIIRRAIQNMYKQI